MSALTLADLAQASAGRDIDVDANPLRLRPDPAQFARFLKAIDRDDISSVLFVRLLESYRELQYDHDADPMR